VEFQGRSSKGGRPFLFSYNRALGQLRVGETAGVTASIDAVTFTAPPDDVQTMLDAADEVMYSAKKAGKDRVHCEVFDLSRRPS
jgi:GGDEF domain-containing protein